MQFWRLNFRAIFTLQMQMNHYEEYKGNPGHVMHVTEQHSPLLLLLLFWGRDFQSDSLIQHPSLRVELWFFDQWGKLFQSCQL